MSETLADPDDAHVERVCTEKKPDSGIETRPKELCPKPSPPSPKKP